LGYFFVVIARPSIQRYKICFEKVEEIKTDIEDLVEKVKILTQYDVLIQRQNLVTVRLRTRMKT